MEQFHDLQLIFSPTGNNQEFRPKPPVLDLPPIPSHLNIGSVNGQFAAEIVTYSVRPFFLESITPKRLEIKRQPRKLIVSTCMLNDAVLKMQTFNSYFYWLFFIDID